MMEQKVFAEKEAKSIYVKFIVQKPTQQISKVLESGQNKGLSSRLSQHEYFYEVNLKLNANLTLFEVLGEVYEEFKVSYFVQVDMERVEFLSRGSKKLAKSKQNMKQAINCEDVLAEVFQDYTALDTILIEICPKTIDVQISIWEMYAEADFILLETITKKNISICTEVCRILSEQNFFKHLTSKKIYSHATYLNIEGHYEKTEEIMNEEQQNKAWENATNLHKLCDVFLLTQANIEIDKFNFNVYQTVFIQIFLFTPSNYQEFLYHIGAGCKNRVTELGRYCFGDQFDEGIMKASKVISDLFNV